MGGTQQWLARFVGNPYVNLGVGLILLMAGLSEAWDTLVDDFRSMQLKGNHGIIVLGVFQILKTIPEIIDGINRLQSRGESEIDHPK